MPPYSIAKSDAAGERTIFVEFMLGCLLDAKLNNKPEEDADYEGVQDKMQDKIQDKLHYKLHYKLHDIFPSYQKSP